MKRNLLSDMLVNLELEVTLELVITMVIIIVLAVIFELRELEPIIIHNQTEVVILILTTTQDSKIDFIGHLSLAMGRLILAIGCLALAT